MSSASSTPCPNCGAPASGKFCSACGAPLGPARCVKCGAALSAGARFCSDCGTPTGAAAVPAARVVAGSRPTPWLPLVITGVAIIALIVLVVSQSRPSASAAAAGGSPGMPLGASSAPDITNMTPRERAARLYDRIMRLSEEQKSDSVTFFAPMALGSYAAIPDIDDDGRYDWGRIAYVTGAIPLAHAQDDTILQHNPTHLLGLLLRADVARAENNPRAAVHAESAFVAAVAREKAKKLPEYEAHGREIDAAVSRLGAKR